MLATLVALLSLCVAAAAPNDRAVIVSYPQNTPNEVLSKAKAAILKAGGVVTHEYRLSGLTASTDHPADSDL